MKQSLIEQERTAEKDLVWYFCHSESDCGIKSNYGAMIYVACYGSGEFHDPYNSFMLNCIHLRRDLEKVLNKLPDKIKKLLYLIYADITYHPLATKTFLKYVGPAYFNSFLTVDQLEKMCCRLAAGNASKEDKLNMSQIRVEAQANYILAHQEYIITKRNYFKELK